MDDNCLVHLEPGNRKQACADAYQSISNSGLFELEHLQTKRNIHD